MSVSGSSIHGGVTGMYETETQRLQRETDAFTKRLEQEKRRLMIIEDQIKQVQSEVGEKKDRIRQVRPTTEQLKHNNAMRRNFEKRIANERLKLNDTIAKNT